jgi:rhomboid protease GluP
MQDQQARPDAAAPQPTARAFGLVTLALVIINVGIYLYQGLTGGAWIDPSPEQLLSWGGNTAMLTLTGDAWRLATSVFVHGGLMHLLMNMYMLFLLGSLAEIDFGRLGLLLIFVAGGVAASCASAWWQSSHTLSSDSLGRPIVSLTVSVGASGAIMAIAGALLATHGFHALFGSHDSPSEAGLGKELLKVVAINVGMGLLLPGVDNAAHIGGVLAGLAMGAAIHFAVKSGGPMLAAAARIAVPPLIGTVVAYALLHAGDWSDLREVRQLHDEQKQAR